MDEVQNQGTVQQEVQQPAPAPERFVDTLSEDLREQGNLKDFKDANSLAKSYVELQRMVGNSVRIPPADATPEARQEFLQKIKDVDGVLWKDDPKLLDKLGRPESPDKYNFEDIDLGNVTEIAPGINDEVEQFKSIAHELGLTNDQVKKLVGMRVETLKNAHEQMADDKAAGEEQLHKIWGQDYDNRLEAAKSVAKKFKEKYGDHMNELNASAGNNPVLLHMLSELAVMYKEKGDATFQTAKFGMTPDMARQKIADKRADTGFSKMLHDHMHAGHAQAVEEMDKLYRIANNEV